jgi:hypothetical protein
MSNPDNTSAIATIKTAHTNAETGGITFPDGTVTSRAAAKAAYAAGGTYATYVATMNKIATWEQTQVDAARDGLRGTYLAGT